MVERGGATEKCAFMTVEEYVSFIHEQLGREIQKMFDDETAERSGETAEVRFGSGPKERALNLVDDLAVLIQDYPDLFSDSDSPSFVTPEEVGPRKGIGASIRLLALKVFGRNGN